MKEKNLILPFIAKAQGEKEDLTYPAELACVACIAELQRKKTGFLRDTPEKLAFFSKVYYPIWLIPAENACLVLDGLGSATHKFTFKEPVKTGAFVEELKKNSTSQQEFMDTIETQTKKIGEFTSPINVPFTALMSDRDLLSFFAEYFKNGSVLIKNEDEKNDIIPLEIDEKTAAETSRAVTDCLRTLQADAKGLQYALEVLKEEVEFHKRATSYEIERLKEKCELETANLRPEVEKKVKKLTLKHDKTLASVVKSTERKVTALEKKRETYMRKLQGIEQKKDAAQKRINTAKKKGTGKSTYGSYELKKYEREIDNVKKEIKAVSEALDKIKKEGNNNAKRVEEEFRSAVAQEESKITGLTAACEAKTADKRKQIDTMTSEAASISVNFENLMDELKRKGASLRQQVEIDWKLDNPDDAVLVRVPIYLIKYTKGNDERYSLFSPITIAEDVGVLDGLRKILTLNSEPKLKALTRPTSKKLHEMFTSNVTEKMQSDEVYRSKISSVCRANNLLDRMEFAETLNEGLDEIVKRGWMTSEEASVLCKRIMEELA